MDRVQESVADEDHPMREQKMNRLPELIERVGVSKATIYRYMRRREFPKCVQLFSSEGGRTTVAWHAAEVDAWLRDPAKWTAEHIRDEKYWRR